MEQCVLYFSQASGGYSGGCYYIIEEEEEEEEKEEEGMWDFYLYLLYVDLNKYLPIFLRHCTLMKVK